MKKPLDDIAGLFVVFCRQLKPVHFRACRFGKGRMIFSATQCRTRVVSTISRRQESHIAPSCGLLYQLSGALRHPVHRAATLSEGGCYFAATFYVTAR